MRILYQAPVAWDWIRQRPHEIAEGLAKCGHQVLWFYAGNFLKVRFRRFDDRNGLEVLELPALPLASRFPPFALLNRLWVSWWFRNYSPDVIVATNPAIFQWMPTRFGWIPAVYDCMDVQVAFYTGLRRRMMIAAERNLLRRVTRIISSSTMIRDRLVSDYSVDADVIDVIPNGLSDRLSTRMASEDVPIRHHIIAYYGTIGKWFDWDSVMAAAQNHPEWKFELFGPVDTVLPLLPTNVTLKGAVPHDMMMKSMASSHVLIMPFVRNELIDGVDPVKMYEYLATGRPIVSSWWPLLKKFENFAAVRFYGETQSLSTVLEDTFKETASFDPPREFLSKCKWSSRVRSFERVLLNNFVPS